MPSLRRLTEFFATHNRVILYDVRGCGMSDDAADLDLDAVVTDTAAVLRACAVPRCAVIAVVHAAPVAIALAATNPELVSSLTLLGPEIDYERRSTIVRVLQQRTPAHLHDSIRRVINPHLSAEDEEGIKAMSAAGAKRWLSSDGTSPVQEAMHSWRVAGLLREVSAPTLVVHYPGHVFSDGPSVAGQIPDARLLTRSGENQPPFNPIPKGWRRS